MYLPLGRSETPASSDQSDWSPVMTTDGVVPGPIAWIDGQSQFSG